MLDKYKSKLSGKRTEKATKNIIKLRNSNVIKTSKNLIKTKSIPKLERTLKIQREALKKSRQIAKVIRESAKQMAKTLKITIKMLMKMVKAIITATKALIMLLTGGLFIVVFIIIIICLIGLLLGSIFGIFFSSEENGTGSKPMNVVIQEINKEFLSQITEIQKNNAHNEYEITSARADWKEVLAVYTVMTSSDDEDVILLTADKIKKLKEIFWEMNDIMYDTKDTTTERIVIGLTSIETVKETTTKLIIKVFTKSAEEMADTYKFNEEKRKQLAELLDADYAKMWNTVIYGSRGGNNDIVEVARLQLGNSGGDIFWSWYGFKERVEWCAVFVSWCANECGYIESGIIPKFATVDTEGVPFFKVCGQWQDGGYVPSAGDIIFFDWESDGRDGNADHVGIVEYVENDIVYTIEGNSDDKCMQREYVVNSLDILGYGTPLY